MGIIEFFKNIIEVKNNDLSFLNVGDIIWARRYQNLTEKNNIKIGHQESPYVIIKKTKDKVYGLQCTSNPHQEIKWKMVYYPLGRLNYEMRKNSYINCLQEYELKEIQFVETIGHLSEYDLNQLKKQLYILINSNFKRKPKVEVKYLDYKIGIGDVIYQNNNRYYIYSSDDKNFYAYRLRKNAKKSMSIQINNSYYSFIFNFLETIKKKSKYDLIDTFNSGEIEIINNFKKNLLEEVKNGKSLRVGAVIDYKNNMYYVYDENEENIFMYQIYTSKIKEPKMANIRIKDGIYKTYFSTKVVKKESLLSNGYNVKRCALKDEIEYNNKVFHLPKNEREKERKKYTKLPSEKDINNFVPMTIIENEINKKHYLIINREENIIEVVNINDLKDKFYFELEKDNCPFNYYRVLSKEEYSLIIKKIQDLKDLVAMLNT